jgi:hypothetical protein
MPDTKPAWCWQTRCDSLWSISSVIRSKCKAEGVKGGGGEREG